VTRRFSRKIRKYRGTRTVGAGSSKHRRGRGSRRTDSGTFGRGFTYYTKYEPERYEHGGFTRPNALEVKGINVDDVQRIAEKAGKKEIDISQYGYQKILGQGKITVALTIKAGSFSKKAEEKIVAAGGKVVKE
jgi:large subunit ribosomal protein L15